MGSRIAALAFLVFAGCFTDVDDPSGSGSTSEDRTTGGPGTETGSAETSTGTPTSSGSSAVAGSSSTETGDESSTGGPPPITEACWGSAEDWVVEMLDIEALDGELPGTPTLSPDGLALHYLAGPAGQRVPYRVERESREDPFTGGAPLEGWNTPPMNLAQLRIAEAGDRLVVRVGSNLEVSSASAGAWETLSAVAFGAEFDELTDPAIDTLGRVLLFARREELRNNAGDSTLIWALYRAAWTGGSPTPSEPERLEFPTFELEHAQLCPVLSPDGEHLFLGSSYPRTWDNAVNGDLDVFESVSEVGAWSQPERVESLSHAEQHACPISVTEDGCELTVRQFDIPFQGNRFLLARRPPPGA